VSRRTLAGSFSEENCAEYARDYQAICPRVRFALDHPGGTQFDYLFMTEATMDRDPVYAWFGKHGLRYYLGSPVADTPNYLAFASLQRTRRQGHVQAGDLDMFELLKPHLARAVSLADQLGTLRAFDRFSSAMLESLPQAVFALDSNCIVHFASGRARALLSRRDGLGVEQGRLTTALASDQAKLDSLMRGALSPLPSSSSGWIRVSRPSGRPPLALFAAPLSIEDNALIATPAKVVVLVHDLADQPCAETGMLTGLYDLTRTEALLASALSGGHSIESAAASLHMQPTTARSHLKSVFRKTGVNRQQDLVRLLTALTSISSQT
jgi:DNA-binding CsgD family transcriptional regulator